MNDTTLTQVQPTLDYDKTLQVVLLTGLSTEWLEQLSTKHLSLTDWQAILAIRLSQFQEGWPMVGSYQVRADGIAFLPRYPLQPGQRYRASFDPAGLKRIWERDPFEVGADQSILQEFDVPQVQVQRSQVMQIYPTSDRLPANLLRFYIYFSEPMLRGEALQHIRLLDESGNTVPDVFLETGEELWNPESTRLTILLDPGRVKTGLRAHSDLGRALTVGRSYRLVIDSSWQDAQEQRLKTSFTKDFSITSEIDASPSIAGWQSEIPQSGTRDPLRLRFPLPLDHLSLLTRIQVLNGERVSLSGKVDIGGQETLWQWTPDHPWQENTYTIKVNPTLEDIAGNNLFGLFDQPSHRDRTLPLVPPTVLQIHPHSSLQLS
jgi:hypothetical protein